MPSLFFPALAAPDGLKHPFFHAENRGLEPQRFPAHPASNRSPRLAGLSSVGSQGIEPYQAPYKSASVKPSGPLPAEGRVLETHAVRRAFLSREAGSPDPFTLRSARGIRTLTGMVLNHVPLPLG